MTKMSPNNGSKTTSDIFLRDVFKSNVFQISVALKVGVFQFYD